MVLSVNDRILFTKNDYQLNIRNGYLGTIQKIESDSKILIKLDNQKRTIELNPKIYSHFTHGYAATIHKTQGTTIKHSLVYASGFGWNQNLAYVALSRHKVSCHIFADKETFKNNQGLIKQFNRRELKDSVLDYPQHFAERRGIITNTEKLISHLKNKLKDWVGVLKEKFDRIIKQQQSEKISVKNIEKNDILVETKKLKRSIKR